MLRAAVILLSLLMPIQALATGQFVKYKVDGESFEGYFAKSVENGPLILMVHDWDGLTDYEVKRAAMLVEQGYNVFVVDLFGDGVRPTETADKKKLTGMLYADREKMRTLLNGGLAKAVELGGNPEKCVAVGYCFGGAAVLELARSGLELRGFVSFHGGLSIPEGQDYSKAKGKLLVLHGTADTAVSMDQFAALAGELEKQKVEHEMITYSGAPHAFTVFGSSRYREDADKKSWRRFSEYLEETVK